MAEHVIARVRLRAPLPCNLALIVPYFDEEVGLTALLPLLRRLASSTPLLRLWLCGPSAATLVSRLDAVTAARFLICGEGESMSSAGAGLTPPLFDVVLVAAWAASAPALAAVSAAVTWAAVRLQRGGTLLCAEFDEGQGAFACRALPALAAAASPSPPIESALFARAAAAASAQVRLPALLHLFGADATAYCETLHTVADVTVALAALRCKLTALAGSSPTLDNSALAALASVAGVEPSALLDRGGIVGLALVQALEDHSLCNTRAERGATAARARVAGTAGAAAPPLAVVIHLPLRLWHVRAKTAGFVASPAADAPVTTWRAQLGVSFPAFDRLSVDAPVSLDHRAFPLVLPPLSLLFGRTVPEGEGATMTDSGYAVRADGAHVFLRGGGSGGVAAAGHASADAAEAPLAVVLDPCFPSGNGAFLNLGLAAWHLQRAAWTWRPPGFAHPPYPPDMLEACEDMMEEIVDTGVREVDLPGPVRLPEMLDLLHDAWTPPPGEDSDTDSAW